MRRNRTAIAHLGAAACLLALTGSVPGVHATDRGVGTIYDVSTQVSWSGTATDPTGTQAGGLPAYPPASPSCAAGNCDDYRVLVDLPVGSLPQPGDGLLVSIHWATDFDQWNLYVDDPSGVQVARGIEVDSNSQAVLIPQPVNGIYTVHVVPFYLQFNTDPDQSATADSTYQGTAAVRLDPAPRINAAAGPVAMLPQLRTPPPTDFHTGDVPFAPSNPTGWRWTPNGTLTNSCYADEQVDYGSRRCLRFDNNIQNVGAGPLTLQFAYDQNLATNCQMDQYVSWSDGSETRRAAGPCVFHLQHAHFHYQNFAVYELHALDAAGNPIGVVATSHKVGFCLIDVDNWAFATPAANARHNTFPTCNVPNRTPSGTSPKVTERMGITPGWGDVYTWDLPAQYVDITGVSDGWYELVSRANPDGGVLEADPTHGLETGITCIQLTTDASGVTTVPSHLPLGSQSNSAPLPACTHP